MRSATSCSRRLWRVVNQWESADGAEPLSDEDHAELARELVMAVRAFYEAVRGGVGGSRIPYLCGIAI